MQLQYQVKLFKLKTRYLAFKPLMFALSQKKEGFLQDCTERKQERAGNITDFTLAINTDILWQNENHFSDSPWFPFSSMSSSKQQLLTRSHVLYSYNFKCLFRQLLLICSAISNYLRESKGFWNHQHYKWLSAKCLIGVKNNRVSNPHLSFVLTK